MDHELTPVTTSNKVESERLILPPISSMDGFFTSKSWPPPSTSFTINNHIVSPSESNSSCMSMQQESSSILSLPITQNNSNNDEPWSPIPNKSNNSHPHNQPRLDYFTTTTNTTATVQAANSSCSSSSLSPMDKNDIRYQHTFKDDHYFRHNSLPQIPTLRKNSINSITSPQQQQSMAPSSSPIHQQQPIFRYQPSNTTTTYSSSNNVNTPIVAAASLMNMNTSNHSSINSNNTNNNASIELMLTSTSLSIHSIEKDIEEVIRHCNSLADNMNQRKSSIVENDNYFSNSTLMRPWLDDMFSQANEVLNALIRLRKHHLVAEYARLHRVSDHQRNLRGADGQDNENWDNSSNIALASTSGVMSLNSVRLRKRGKRPTFQGRCHSCNISETPEWRKGPDGARTLCNACGLHYAKLTKKKVKQEDRDATSM